MCIGAVDSLVTIPTYSESISPCESIGSRRREPLRPVKADACESRSTRRGRVVSCDASPWREMSGRQVPASADDVPVCPGKRDHMTASFFHVTRCDARRAAVLTLASYASYKTAYRAHSVDENIDSTPTFAGQLRFRRACCSCAQADARQTR